MTPSAARRGRHLRIGGRELEFSLYPVRLDQGGWITNSRAFATDPWAVMARAVEVQCPRRRRRAALAFLEQAHDFYKAGTTAGIAAAKPVLLYYCFLNLAKAFILTRRLQPSLDHAYHGLKERLHPGRKEPVGAYLEAVPTALTKVNAFDEFLRAVRRSSLAGNTRYDVPVLMPQIVTGHRLLVSASRKRERFLPVARIAMLDDGAGKIWLQLQVARGEVARLLMPQKDLLPRAGLAPGWQLVNVGDASSLGIELVQPVSYSSSWVANSVPSLVDKVRLRLWQIVASAPPYRRYYLYLAPPGEQPQVLPQLLCVYAIMYYLSSITRYRPHQFDTIVEGAYGPFIEGFLNDQPRQFVFLMASEFTQRDVTKAAIV